MPDLYVPSLKTLEQLETLVQGFLLEFDDNETVVLLVKFDDSIISKLISGVDIELVIRNPRISGLSITLYIFDREKDPLYVTWQNFTEEDKNYKGIDIAAIEILKSQHIRVAYYNNSNLPVFSTILETHSGFEEFKKWIYGVYTRECFIEESQLGHYFPESLDKGFKIKILNQDHSNAKMLSINSLEQSEIWGENWVGGQTFYDYSNLSKEGRHGYAQELSVRSMLMHYFEPHIELFYSPKAEGGLELTDFLVYYKKAVLLIESKFVKSHKQTKLNQAAKKATDQLITTKNKISSLNIEDPKLKEKLKDIEVLLSICVYNDTLQLISLH